MRIWLRSGLEWRKTCKWPEGRGVGEKKGKFKRYLKSPGERQGICDEKLLNLLFASMVQGHAVGKVGLIEETAVINCPAADFCNCSEATLMWDDRRLQLLRNTSSLRPRGV